MIDMKDYDTATKKEQHDALDAGLVCCGKIFETGRAFNIHYTKKHCKGRESRWDKG